MRTGRSFFITNKVNSRLFFLKSRALRGIAISSQDLDYYQCTDLYAERRGNVCRSACPRESSAPSWPADNRIPRYARDFRSFNADADDLRAADHIAYLR